MRTMDTRDEDIGVEGWWRGQGKVKARVARDRVRGVYAGEEKGMQSILSKKITCWKQLYVQFK